MVLAMLLALWLDRERASPCIFVLACTHNAYKDWEVGERATVLAGTLVSHWVHSPFRTALRGVYASLQTDPCPKIWH